MKIIEGTMNEHSHFKNVQCYSTGNSKHSQFIDVKCYSVIIYCYYEDS